TEYIPDYAQIQHMLLPRLAALSEVAWSHSHRTSYENFVERIETSLLPLYDSQNYNYSTYAFQNPPIE
ncbi:MAG: beta-N-acetylhexosaminidase, partial [Candidatus Cryptobacteroides sp.]